MREKFNHMYLDSHERKLLVHRPCRVKKSAYSARQIYGLC